MWYNIIKERKVLKMRKPRLSERTIEKLFHGEVAKIGKYEYATSVRWNAELQTFEDILTRWDEDNNYEEWTMGNQGIYEFKK